MDYINWFLNVESALCTWDESQLVMCIIFLILKKIWLANILLKIFASMLMSDSDL